MKSILLAAAAVTIVASFGATAQPLGPHPAIAVQRMQATAGYDYASKFYPHPAWLYLAAEAPRRMNDHPAVTIARRQQQEREHLVARMLAEARLPRP